MDKITILEIKVARLAGADARANAGRELLLLRDIAQPALADPKIAPLTGRLKSLNEALWEIEDRVRDHERRGDFGEGFVALARSVYLRNDERGRVKRAINDALGSRLVEEKNYTSY